MDLSRLQENGMYAILTILWCVHDSNLDSALQLPFILHVIMSQNLPEMCFLFLSLVKSGSIFRDAELVSLGGWLSKRMYKRSKIMVKSISILIWSQLTPSYLLSVCRLRMHSDLGPSFQVITNLCSTSLSRLHVYFFSIWSSLIRLDQGRCAQ